MDLMTRFFRPTNASCDGLPTARDRGTPIEPRPLAVGTHRIPNTSAGVNYPNLFETNQI